MSWNEAFGTRTLRVRERCFASDTVLRPPVEATPAADDGSEPIAV